MYDHANSRCIVVVVVVLLLLMPSSSVVAVVAAAVFLSTLQLAGPLKFHSERG